MDGTTERISFPGAGGETLAAALERPPGTPGAWALFAHCFSCSKDIRAAREVSRGLRAAGFAVLRFDFTGLGLSEGDFANTNFSSNVADLEAAAAFLRREYEAPTLYIGHSLGGAAALVAAARDPDAKAVATIGAPAEAAHVLGQIGDDKRAEIAEAGVATVDLGGRPFTVKRQFLEDLEGDRVAEAAAALRRPLLILHAPLDAVVGIDNATRLFVAAKHPKSFVSLDGADHLLSQVEDARYAAGVIAAWARRYVEAGAPEAADAARPAAFPGGARARSVPGRALAVALNVDGHAMTIDASAAEGGDDLGPNPTRTVEGALAACAAMTATLYARRKGWPLEGVEVEVRRAEDADAHVSRALEKTLRFDGPLDADQKERLREIADKCPVHRMLSEGVSISSALAP